MGDERGQGTVEWVGTLAVVSLLLVGLVAAGVRVPGGELARGIASKILCAVELADGCGDEPVLIATYGDEIGRLVRRHMPTIGFEAGSRAVPVDWRRCRLTECGDGADDGLVHRTEDRLPVTAFTHVVDCRAAARAQSEAEGDDCSDDRAGSLYIQYWLYYANSAGLISSNPGNRFSSISRTFVPAKLDSWSLESSSGNSDREYFPVIGRGSPRWPLYCLIRGRRTRKRQG